MKSCVHLFLESKNVLYFLERAFLCHKIVFKVIPIYNAIVRFAFEFVNADKTFYSYQLNGNCNQNTHDASLPVHFHHFSQGESVKVTCPLCRYPT